MSFVMILIHDLFLDPSFFFPILLTIGLVWSEEDQLRSLFLRVSITKNRTHIES